MHWIDWLIVILPLLAVAIIGWRTQRYIQSVSDFLAAGRVAGRYVIAVATGEAAMGLISVVATVEFYYQSGFAIQFWASLAIPVSIVILLTGFAIYRFRETRAMTMAQFFEVRYGKKFRIFAGILQVFSGILNYGLFPAVGARFIIYYCDLPQYISIFGMHWPMFAIVMLVFLSIAVLISNVGGQITIMVTDCVQGILSYPMYMAVVVAILIKFSWWDHISPTLLSRPPGESLLNPFDTYNLQDFNLFYILVGIFASVFNMMSWSGTQGYNCAAASPHEQKMGKILGTWRTGFSMMMIILIAAAAFTYMHHTDFSEDANNTQKRLSSMVLHDISPLHDAENIAGTENPIEEQIERLDAGDRQVFETIQNQMLVPVALADILPIGVTGMFGALMIFLLISTDTTSIHSWGSILIQDIVLPLRKKPFTPQQQIRLLRWSISFVAIFAFIFSLFFGQVTYILMFFALTGSVYLGGAGAVILGGLYWKKGTSAGAWGAMIAGSGIAILGFAGQQLWVDLIYPMLASTPHTLEIITTLIEGISYPFEPMIQWRVSPDKFPINGQEIYFITMMSAIAVYIILSLLTYQSDFNMDRMFHRGKYARKEAVASSTGSRSAPAKRSFLKELLGIDDQFTKGDKILSWSVFIYSFVWGFGSWLVIVIWNLLFHPWTKEWWSMWFFINSICLAFAIGLISTIWFFIGGIWDLNRLFKRLKSLERNVLDDGRVVGHVNADDAAMVDQINHNEKSKHTESDRPQ